MAKRTEREQNIASGLRLSGKEREAMGITAWVTGNIWAPKFLRDGLKLPVDLGKMLITRTRPTLAELLRNRNGDRKGQTR